MMLARLAGPGFGKVSYLPGFVYLQAGIGLRFKINIIMVLLNDQLTIN